MSELVSVKNVHIEYQKQIVNGPLKVLTDLIEKEHFLAAKDILPIVKESLETFEVSPETVNPAPIPVDAMKPLVEGVEKLSADVQALCKLLSDITVPQTVPAEVHTEESN